MITLLVKMSGISTLSPFEPILKSYLFDTCSQIQPADAKRPGSSHIENGGIDYQISLSISDMLDGHTSSTAILHDKIKEEE